jgi:hypothetical protein
MAATPAPLTVPRFAQKASGGIPLCSMSYKADPHKAVQVLITLSKDLLPSIRQAIITNPSLLVQFIVLACGKLMVLISLVFQFYMFSLYILASTV